MSYPILEYPILEYDDTREAILEPSRLIEPLPAMPVCGVITFFQDVINHFVEQGLAREIGAIRSEMGNHPIYVHTPVQRKSPRFADGDQEVALFHPGVGAPLAAGLLEEVIALGCRRFVVCGGAGVLNRELAAGHLVVPTAAIRDEGTSYHYAPPGREVAPDPSAVDAICRVLARHNVPFVQGKTWTTDAIYRETRPRMMRRREEGCLTVEMEAAALFAVAQFRGVPLAQILYSGDNLDAEEWDGREWQKNWNVREKLVEMAVEACLEIPVSNSDTEG